MANDDDRLLTHDYDGIQEYDNPLPGWWTALFWLTVVFAAGYLAYYHALGDGKPALGEYTEEIAALQAVQAQFALPELSDAALQQVAADPQRVAAGATKFKEVCAACHGEQAEGKIGPNLTDGAWLHGGKLINIYHTIGNGVPAKGMPAWSRTLKPDQIQNLLAFVASVRGKNVTGKAPQGQFEVVP